MGEVVGVVGEKGGNGKSTSVRSLLGLVPATPARSTFEDVDIATMSRSDLRKIRQYVQMIFQDPNAALNPAMTIEQILRTVVGRGSGSTGGRRGGQPPHRCHHAVLAQLAGTGAPP